LGQNYRDEIILSVIEPIGYKQRVENYYIIREYDGYVNIDYFKDINDITHIRFNKNFYHGALPTYRDSKRFDNYSNFFKFLEAHHKQYFRTKKLKQICQKFS